MGSLGGVRADAWAGPTRRAPERAVTLPLPVLFAGPFGALDPFGSGSFNSAEGFADFSQMSKVKLSRGAPVPLLVSVCCGRDRGLVAAGHGSFMPRMYFLGTCRTLKCRMHAHVTS